MSDNNIETVEVTGEVQRIFCDNCFETLLFSVKDKNKEFAIGLETIIRCLEFAENESLIPPLPDEWWLSVKRHYWDLE